MPSTCARPGKAFPAGMPQLPPFLTIIRRVILHRSQLYETQPKHLLEPTPPHTHRTQFQIYKKYSKLYTPCTKPEPPKTNEPTLFLFYYCLEQNAFLMSFVSGDTLTVFPFLCGVWIPLSGHTNTAFYLWTTFTIWGIYLTLSV